MILRLLSDRRRLFNQQLFGGQLDIEAVLAAEDQFKGQLSLVRQYLSGQQRVWAYLQNDEIDGQHLR